MFNYFEMKLMQESKQPLNYFQRILAADKVLRINVSKSSS
jgi:hypothetical protein